LDGKPPSPKKQAVSKTPRYSPKAAFIQKRTWKSWQRSRSTAMSPTGASHDQGGSKACGDRLIFEKIAQTEAQRKPEKDFAAGLRGLFPEFKPLTIQAP